MILGIGTDIIDIEEIRQSIQRFGARYTKRFFTADERDYCDARPDPASHYAARFAAKEAFIKACSGVMDQAAFPFSNIEVAPDPSRRPEYRLHGAAREILAPHRRLHLSLSHSQHAAMAVAALEEFVL
jgi:holo-[acyl-carrier protein] synthase